MGWPARIRRILKKKAQTTSNNRFFYVGNQTPGQAGEGYVPQTFPNNKLKTSKYTIWNFIPKNLFEQFRRIANFYFLCVAVIQLCIDSPVSPSTSTLPLIFVISVTAAKQAYEDWLRHRGDEEVNQRPVEIAKEGSLQKIKSKAIQVGDIVLIRRDEGFPCDLVLLSSSNPEGKCCITTANLDGETNLKVRYGPKETKVFNTPALLSTLCAAIECQNPTADLYTFLGKMKVYASNNTHQGPIASVSLGPDNVLLKGSRLKDTEYIYGCAVYTGPEAKMALNSKLTSNKFSTVEKTMNAFLIFYMFLLLVQVGTCTALKYAYESSAVEGHPWYWSLESKHVVTFKGVLQDFFSFLIIFNYVIPISLYVTLELQKFLGSLFFKWDQELTCEETNQVAICNSSDLNEELGQVQYLFTDKTGTLTENLMQFRQCSINGLKYMEKNSQLLQAEDASDRRYSPVQNFTTELEDFFVVLALCHTVRVSRQPNGTAEEANHLQVPKSKFFFKPRKEPAPTNGSVTPGDPSSCASLEAYVNRAFVEERPMLKGQYEYQASSPDEKALVEACTRLGIVYHGDEEDVCILTVRGETRRYKRLHVLDFDSDRKRMSVIMEFPDETIWLLCKGAESAIVTHSIMGPTEDTLRHVTDYALLGLRTLVMAKRQLSAEEFAQFDLQYNLARQVLSDREREVAHAFSLVERELVLLGATGVEDRLQDGVPETLESLRAAGIKIWILTGDKMETAVNVSFSCGHFKRGTVQLWLTAQSSPVQCQVTLRKLRRQIWDEPMQQFGLVIDGESLALALKHHKEILAEVCQYCTGVVCCRMSPIQKAEVVKLAKGFPSKPVTAAIGDGANDVSMIQEAHVGLGIMGKEGRQAVRCSDFAFAKFRFLRRVLLVHGHWYYWRVSTLVQYFFYKNLAFITPVVYFAFCSAYSTQPLYDSFFLTFFNIFFTSLPILIFGLLEQNFSPDQLLTNVHLYRDISGNARMSWAQFFKWSILGLWHSLVPYYGSILLWEGDQAFFANGQPLDLWSFGTLVYQAVVFVVNIQLLLESRYWTWLYLLCIFISVMGFVGLTFVYSGFYIKYLNNWPFYWVYINMLSSGTIWLAFLLMLVLSLLPDMLLGVWETYSVGDGVLVHQVWSMKLRRTDSALTTVTVISTQSWVHGNGEFLRYDTDLLPSISQVSLIPFQCQPSHETVSSGSESPESISIV